MFPSLLGMTRNPLPAREVLERARIGATIRTLRKTRGLSTDSLATSLGISRPYLSNIEAGRKPLTHQLLVQLADLLEVDRRDITQNWDAVA